MELLSSLSCMSAPLHNQALAEHLREIVQCSLGSTPEKMLERALQACIDISGATGGSILGEEGPYLQFLFSDVPGVVGARVPFDSIAGATVRNGRIIYTYAPTDKRHFAGIDAQTNSATRYLLSIPIPSIHQSATDGSTHRNAGALQLLFDSNVLPGVQVEAGPEEFDLATFRQEQYDHLSGIFLILPNIAFGMEVITLRQTSYQAIHELKNKFISAQSWLGYLKSDIEQQAPDIFSNETISGDLELTRSTVGEGAALAKTYLEFTKIYEPHFIEADINDVLAEVVASARAFAKDQPIVTAVVFEGDKRIARRQLDPAQLKMAFFNLCKNAIEALVVHAVADATITVKSSLVDGRLSVEVADNGPGMPREIADNLFIPFKTKKEGGTGLGLTITKKIVNVNGGGIRCQTSDAGTVFTVVF